MAAAALTLCAACSYNPDDYSCFGDVDPVAGWGYGSKFIYLPKIQDSIASGQLKLMVRHTNDYPYSNLWLELETQQPADSGHVMVVRDTICVELADIYGNWLGSGLGVSFQKVDTIYADFSLANGAPLKLRHIMRPEKVTGLEQVGVIFQANGQ